MNYGEQRQRQILRGFGIKEDVIEKYGVPGMKWGKRKTYRKEAGKQLEIDFETGEKRKKLKQKIEDVESKIESKQYIIDSTLGQERVHSVVSRIAEKKIKKFKEELRGLKVNLRKLT